MATTVKDRRAHGDDSDKDSTEDELERLVFGDSAGFRDNVRSFRDAGDLSRGKELVLAGGGEDEADGTGLEGVSDQDLFFLDDTPGDAPIVPITATTDDESTDGREIAAWTDSDDERITVSLTSRTQLRKLRRTEVDDFVSGKEYSRRLRKQFELLNPVPEWVLMANATTGRPRKKRRTSSGSAVTDTSEDEDEIDVDGDDEDSLSAQPLARLLQDVDGLSRTTRENGASKKRKLRPEVIDIQRMKDIVPSGPVSRVLHYPSHR
jgi:U3 small nucleolar RNA-associated protein 18